MTDSDGFLFIGNIPIPCDEKHLERQLKLELFFDPELVKQIAQKMNEISRKLSDNPTKGYVV